MSTRKTGIRTVVVKAMVIALFLQTACTLHEAMAREKATVLSMRMGANSFKKTIDLARYINANRYEYWIIYWRAADTKDSWNTYHNVDSLESFLKYNASLGSKGIDVKVTACKGYFNHMDHIVIEYLARLSLKYPRLKAYNINDFAPAKISPTKLKAFLDAKDRINPNFKFLPCLYHGFADRGTGLFLENNPYDPILSRDGTLLYFWASYGTRPMRLKDLDMYLTQANQEVHPAPFITGLYPIRLAQLWEMKDKGWPVDSLFHKPDTLRKMLKMSLERSDGVILWHNITLYLGEDGKTIKSSSGSLPGARPEFQQAWKIVKEVFGTAAEPNISSYPAKSSGGFGITEASVSKYGTNFIVSPQKPGEFGLSVYDVVGRKIWKYQGKAAGGAHSVAWESTDSGVQGRQMQSKNKVYFVVFKQGNTERAYRFLNME